MQRIVAAAATMDWPKSAAAMGRVRFFLRSLRACVRRRLTVAKVRHGFAHAVNEMRARLPT